jgi:putative restriction endonuclease
MHPEELKEKILNIRTWQRGDERAPHKPLLLLYSLARVARGEPRFVSYEEAVDDLRKLLEEFGPYRRTHQPSYPFVRLCNDEGIWEIEGSCVLDTRLDWSDRDLIKNNTSSGFTAEVYDLLKQNNDFVKELAGLILNQYFPDTLHEDILARVGLDLEKGVKTVRSPDFRNKVLRAYEYQCAVCGFNVRLGDTLVAVEAAHIKWHQYGGPDCEENGIALCSMHHKLFDRGVFTLDESLVFRVSEEAHGTSGFDEWLLRYHGRPIRRPQRPDYYPNENYINWHAREVFRGPHRYASSL